MADGTSKMGPIWPFLFITVACGAISGFHCLVAGGTSSKQVSKESAVKKVTFIYSLFILLIEKYLPKNNIMLSVVDVLLMILSIGVVIIAFNKWMDLRKNPAYIPA